MPSLPSNAGSIQSSMSCVVWTRENGYPRILAIMDEVFASTGETQHHTYQEFEAIVGETVAEAALNRYFREQDRA
jgi:hypothetical protein